MIATGLQIGQSGLKAYDFYSARNQVPEGGTQK
jgi:hypothetical protein